MALRLGAPAAAGVAQSTAKRLARVLKVHHARRSIAVAANNTATATAVREVEQVEVQQPEPTIQEGPLSQLFPPVPDAVPRMTAPKPGHMDATRFQLDASVYKWCNPDKPYSTASEDGALSAASRYVAAATAAGDVRAATFWAYHAARFTFFAAQGFAGLLSHGVAEQLDPRGGTAPGDLPLTRISGNAGPEFAMRLVECYGTWEQDLAFIQAGAYNMPWDMITPNKQYNPLFMLAKTAQFMREGADTLKRRLREAEEPVWMSSSMYPEYYTKTFHYQSDGWLSDWSARLYEHSTETLFSGRQDAMQRMSLVPISEYLASRRDVPVSEMRLLEVAAGTGRFHTFVKDNWPTMRSVCSDLSPFYLQRARANMQEWKALRKPNLWLGGTDNLGVDFMQAAAESLGVPDESFDIVVSVYLFHELPEAARRKAVAEWFRVLKPGGLCVFTDSAQMGDRPEWDHTMGRFSAFNEPFYVSYVQQDLGAMFEEAGFQPRTKYLSSATKTLSFIKPE